MEHFWFGSISIWTVIALPGLDPGIDRAIQ
jgi:hypothetical protein